jgi:hypothetical protein
MCDMTIMCTANTSHIVYMTHVALHEMNTTKHDSNATCYSSVEQRHAQLLNVHFIFHSIITFRGFNVTAPLTL